MILVVATRAEAKWKESKEKSVQGARVKHDEAKYTKGLFAWTSDADAIVTTLTRLSSSTAWKQGLPPGIDLEGFLQAVDKDAIHPRPAWKRMHANFNNSNAAQQLGVGEDVILEEAKSSVNEQYLEWWEAVSKQLYSWLKSATVKDGLAKDPPAGTLALAGVAATLSSTVMANDIREELAGLLRFLQDTHEAAYDEFKSKCDPSLMSLQGYATAAFAATLKDAITSQVLGDEACNSLMTQIDALPNHHSRHKLIIEEVEEVSHFAAAANAVPLPAGAGANTIPLAAAAAAEAPVSCKAPRTQFNVGGVTFKVGSEADKLNGLRHQVPSYQQIIENADKQLAECLKKERLAKVAVAEAEQASAQVRSEQDQAKAELQRAETELEEATVALQAATATAKAAETELQRMQGAVDDSLMQDADERTSQAKETLKSTSGAVRDARKCHEDNSNALKRLEEQISKIETIIQAAQMDKGGASAVQPPIKRTLPASSSVASQGPSQRPALVPGVTQGRRTPKDYHNFLISEYGYEAVNTGTVDLKHMEQFIHKATGQAKNEGEASMLYFRRVLDD